MKNPGLICLFLIPIFWGSCRSDFETVPGTGDLEFSKDTVFLDTVFTNIGSSTYNLKVYNRSSEDILIPEIKLNSGEASHFRLNVDGMTGKFFENIEILARDSIFVFIEITADIDKLTQAETQFLYTDAIEFDLGENMQSIPLVSLVLDAVFLYPEKNNDGSTETLTWTDQNGNQNSVEGFLLNEDELHFNSNKPYVIYGYAMVPPEKILKINAGARIRFHANSGIVVSENASIQVKGKWSEDPKRAKNEVIFEGNRLEPGFSNVPGQWGTIWLMEGSLNNIFEYSTIKNATLGLFIEGNSGFENNPVIIRNSQIYNSATTGILAKNAHFSAENMVINNSGQASLQILGGKYQFRHATFVNYWQQGNQLFHAVIIGNEVKIQEEISIFDLEAQFSNSIIYGNKASELVLNLNENAGFEVSFESCLIRVPEASENYPSISFQNCLFNEDPDFLLPQKNDLRLGENSAAINTADLNTALNVPLDILRNDRTQDPDIGAYEFVPKVGSK